MNEVLYEKDYTINCPEEHRGSPQLYQKILTVFFKELDDSRVLNFIAEGVTKILVKTVLTFATSENEITYNISVNCVEKEELKNKLLRMVQRHEKGMCPVYCVHDGEEILLPEMEGISWKK